MQYTAGPHFFHVCKPIIKKPKQAKPALVLKEIHYLHTNTVTNVRGDLAGRALTGQLQSSLQTLMI